MIGHGSAQRGVLPRRRWKLPSPSSSSSYAAVSHPPPSVAVFVLTFLSRRASPVSPTYFAHQGSCYQCVFPLLIFRRSLLATPLSAHHPLSGLPACSPSSYPTIPLLSSYFWHFSQIIHFRSRASRFVGDWVIPRLRCHQELWQGRIAASDELG